MSVSVFCSSALQPTVLPVVPAIEIAKSTPLISMSASTIAPSRELVASSTYVAVVMPARLAEVFRALGDYAVWHPRVGLPAFDVSVHGSWRFAGDPGTRWLREQIVALFGEK